MLIAELCGNHLGNRETLKEMVFRAKEAGAWAAKIQTFFADDLSDGWRHTYNRVKKSELSWDDHSSFVSWCREAEIEPMTSVYSREYALKLASVGFKWIKIGSAQAHDKDLVDMYIALGFKVII